jgi:polyadenylate-binding protein
MSNNTKEKTILILCDLPTDVNESDIEAFLSQYKNKIKKIQLNEKKPIKATVSFEDYNSADECRKNMNQRKLKNKIIRIMWDEKDFLQKNKDNKNNLYIRNIPKNKTPRELYEYFIQFGDVFSMKNNENENGNINGTAFVTYYKQEDAKKAIDNTNGKKIWDSDMEVQYQKNNDKTHHNDNTKINISNLPEKYTEQEITKLCEEFGKIHICNIKQGEKGKYAIVKFENEQEAKKAMEKLNNKEIGDKKIYTKEVKDNHYYNNYKQFYPQPFYNKPMIKLEEPIENNNLYVKNIPMTATEEDLKKTFGQFGKITSIKLEREETKTEDKQKIITNKGYGYISFETLESAKKAYEQLNGKYMEGFIGWTRPLYIDYFISKEKRQSMNMMQSNYYGMPNNPMIYPGMNNSYIYPQIFLHVPGWNNPGNYHNKGGFNYKQRNNNNGYSHGGKGGHKGGYHRNNYQKKNNDRKNENNINSNINNDLNTNTNEEKKIFDYDKYNKLETEDEKKEFLGDKIFEVIQENVKNTGKNIDTETIGKITGMIIQIPNEEIIEIYENPSILDSRVNEALELLKPK